jgi:D-amino-acid dehydrogenase
MSESLDAVVVGGGAIGVACAYELAKRGASVVVAEAGDAVGAGCSYGNAGLISRSHCIPLAAPGLLRQIPRWLRPGGAIYVKPRLSIGLALFGLALARSCSRERMLIGVRALRDLSRASCDLFKSLVRDEGLDFGYRREGLMNVCSTHYGLEPRRRAGKAALGRAVRSRYGATTGSGVTRRTRAPADARSSAIPTPMK